MLSTPPRGDAVSIDYRIKLVLLTGTCTQLIQFTCKRAVRGMLIPR